MHLCLISQECQEKSWGMQHLGTKLFGIAYKCKLDDKRNKFTVQISRIQSRRGGTRQCCVDGESYLSIGGGDRIKLPRRRTGIHPNVELTRDEAIQVQLEVRNRFATMSQGYQLAQSIQVTKRSLFWTQPTSDTGNNLGTVPDVVKCINQVGIRVNNICREIGLSDMVFAFWWLRLSSHSNLLSNNLASLVFKVNILVNVQG